MSGVIGLIQDLQYFCGFRNGIKEPSSLIWIVLARTSFPWLRVLPVSVQLFQAGFSQDFRKETWDSHTTMVETMVRAIARARSLLRVRVQYRASKSEDCGQKIRFKIRAKVRAEEIVKFHLGML